MPPAPGPDRPDHPGAADATIARLQRELAAAEARAAFYRAILETVNASIFALDAAVVQLGDRLLLLPLMGEMGPSWAREIMGILLQAIQAHRAAVVVLDITGVPMVDTEVAGHLVQMARSARLLGARVVLTGVS